MTVYVKVALTADGPVVVNDDPSPADYVMTRERLARLLCRAYEVPVHLAAPWAERPVDRARRLRIERAMRLRARRASRRSRKAPR